MPPPMHCGRHYRYVPYSHYNAPTNAVWETLQICALLSLQCPYQCIMGDITDMCPTLTTMPPPMHCGRHYRYVPYSHYNAPTNAVWETLQICALLSLQCPHQCSVGDITDMCPTLTTMPPPMQCGRHYRYVPYSHHNAPTNAMWETLQICALLSLQCPYQCSVGDITDMCPILTTMPPPMQCGRHYRYVPYSHHNAPTNAVWETLQICALLSPQCPHQCSVGDITDMCPTLTTMPLPMQCGRHYRYVPYSHYNAPTNALWETLQICALLSPQCLYQCSVGDITDMCPTVTTMPLPMQCGRHYRYVPYSHHNAPTNAVLETLQICALLSLQCPHQCSVGDITHICALVSLQCPHQCIVGDITDMCPTLTTMPPPMHCGRHYRYVPYSHYNAPTNAVWETLQICALLSLQCPYQCIVGDITDMCPTLTTMPPPMHCGRHYRYVPYSHYNAPTNAVWETLQICALLSLQCPHQCSVGDITDMCPTLTTMPPPMQCGRHYRYVPYSHHNVPTNAVWETLQICALLSLQCPYQCSVGDITDMCPTLTTMPPPMQCGRHYRYVPYSHHNAPTNAVWETLQTCTLLSPQCPHQCSVGDITDMCPTLTTMPPPMQCGRHYRYVPYSHHNAPTNAVWETLQICALLSPQCPHQCSVGDITDMCPTLTTMPLPMQCGRHYRYVPYSHYNAPTNALWETLQICALLSPQCLYQCSVGDITNMCPTLTTMPLPMHCGRHYRYVPYSHYNAPTNAVWETLQICALLSPQCPHQCSVGDITNMCPTLTTMPPPMQCGRHYTYMCPTLTTMPPSIVG